ncbi:hypothetical protein BSNK01_26960 [Bacillaceae bacterium]
MAMKVKVLLFARLAELARQKECWVEIEEPATVGALKEKISREYPVLASLVPQSVVSVNLEYAAPDQVVKEGDEIALIPPVSGGEEPLYKITTEPLSADKLISLVSSPHAGAVLTFVGTVREYTQGRRTVHLEYEAYETMAVKKLQQIGEEIAQKWPQAKTAIHHRVGKLEIEDISVIIAVATPHRPDAFAAGRYAIERLKQIVPIWKKEVFADGYEWKGHQQGPWNPQAELETERVPETE